MPTRTLASNSAAKKQPARIKEECALEVVLRHTMHDIIDHLLKHWDAFSSAAKDAKVTPAQALASLLTKATIEVLESAADGARAKR